MRGKTAALHLLYRLADGAFNILELALAIALLAEIPTIEQLVPDLVQRQTAAGGMFRPRHISAVKITAVDGIGMKFSEQLDARALSAFRRRCGRISSSRAASLSSFFVMPARNSTARE
jgi:hypothetical protein